VESLADRTTASLMLDLLHEAIFAKNVQLNALAVELLPRCGELPVRKLVVTALKRKNPRARRLRALQVLACIGLVGNPMDLFDVIPLMHDPHLAIREAAASRRYPRIGGRAAPVRIRVPDRPARDETTAAAVLRVHA
jgi:hypothetical protein